MPKLAPGPAQSPIDTELYGSAVVTGVPGRLLASSALLIAAVFGVQTLVGGHDPKVAEAHQPEVVSAAVTEALSRAEPEVASEISETAPSTVAGAAVEAPGLVNLLRRMAPETPSPEPGLPDTPAPPISGDKDGSIQAIEDPTGEAMKAFYKSLRRTRDKIPGATTRIIHFGDSTIVADLITGSARRKLQRKFGDGGHGWLLIGKPWSWYTHHNVKHRVSDGWKLNRITTNTIKDNRYGLGGVSSRTRSKRAWAEFMTDEKGAVGGAISRFQLFYLGQPGGGRVTIRVDGAAEGTEIDTSAATATDEVAAVEMTDGPHKVRVEADGGGEVRLYGVVMERAEPGVVYDSLGITGIRAKTLGRFNGEHFKGQLALRDPNLVIVMIGTNESEFIGMNMKEYERDYTKLIGRIRAGVPGASCLVASPPDRGYKDAHGRMVTHPMIPKIIEVQHRVALEQGCAFWNTYEAMGGKNSMVAWFRHKPRLGSGDFTHFTVAGGEALGIMLYDALAQGVE